MKISCPSCAAKYSVADEKIRARLAKIRCRKCSSTIVIDGNVTPPAVRVAEASGAVGAASPAPAPAEPSPTEVGPAAGEYAVDIADNDQRNMTVEQLVEAYNTGVISGDTYIWKEGMPDWQVVAETPEVCAALHEAAEKGGAAAPAAPAPAGDTSAADLFGGIDRAGSEDEIATSAPEPGPVATGARNESSVLFSLSALTGQAEPTPKGDKGSPHRDDSGLIDLQALTASGNEAAPGLGASPFMALPLGAASPLETGFAGGAAASGAIQSERRRGTGLLWLGGGVLLVVCALLVLLVTNDRFGVLGAGQAAAPAAQVAPPHTQELSHTPGGEPAAEAIGPAKGVVSPASQQLAAPAPPIVEPAAEAAQQTEVPSDTELKPETPPRKAVAVRPAPKPRAKRSSSRTRRRRTRQPKSKPAPAPTPRARKAPAPAAKKAAPCNCKPTDLMCAMRCSAKK